MINWRVITSLPLNWALIINALGIFTLYSNNLDTLQKRQGVLFSTGGYYPRIHYFLKI